MLKNNKQLALAIASATIIAVVIGVNFYKNRNLSTLNNIKVSASEVRERLDEVLILTDEDKKNLSTEEIEKMTETYTDLVIQEIENIKLLELKGKELNILPEDKVIDKEVEEQITSFRKNFETEDDFNNYLKENKLDLENLRKDTRKNIISNYMYGYLFKDITVSDKETKEFYNKNKDSFVCLPHASLYEIKVDTMDKANEIYKELKKGKDFEKIAKKYNSKESTHIGTYEFHEETLVHNKEVTNAVKKLKSNEYTKPYKVDDGVVIILAKDVQSEKRQKSYKEVHQELQANMLAEKQFKSFDSQMNKWREDMKK